MVNSESEGGLGNQSSKVLTQNNPPLSLVSSQELWQWRFSAKEKAIAVGIPPEEVDWLLREVTNLDRLSLQLQVFKNQIEMRLSLSELNQLWQQRLEERKPIQYLVSSTPWRRFALVVSPAVLIPRPETECLIDLAVAAVNFAPGEIPENYLLVQSSQIQLANSNFPGDWVDLGTGSGAIACGLAEVFPFAQIHAVDYSIEALAIAQKNAENLGFSERMQFYQGSWWEPLGELKGKLRGMVANPPYIPSAIVPTLQPEVAWHEPHLALDGGNDGLDSIRHLIATAPEYLLPGGIWLIEMMVGQARIVSELLQAQGSYNNVQIFRDLAGIERFALAYRN